jgi:hypothetical protein
MPCFRTFIKLERDTDFGGRPRHGDRGSIPSTRDLDVDFTEIGEAGFAALEGVGFPIIDDQNRPGAVGSRH